MVHPSPVYNERIFKGVEENGSEDHFWNVLSVNLIVGEGTIRNEASLISEKS